MGLIVSGSQLLEAQNGEKNASVACISCLSSGIVMVPLSQCIALFFMSNVFFTSFLVSRASSFVLVSAVKGGVDPIKSST